jgi:Delta24(24(1))-sterol reductase
VRVKGLKLPDGTQLTYNCNALWAWWLTLGGAAALHVSGVVPLTAPVRMLGPLLTVAVIAGNALSAATHAAAHAYGNVRPFLLGSLATCACVLVCFRS